MLFPDPGGGGEALALLFFGIAFGKLNSEEHDLIGLSLNSPLGKLMTEKTAGDEFTFMNRKYIIQNVN